MSTYGVGDWQREAQVKQKRLATQIAAGKQRLEAHQKTEAGLDEKRVEALSALSTAMLPELSPEAVAQAVRWSGYAALGEEDIVAEKEATRLRLEQRNAEIEADPLFARKAERDPESGELALATQRAQAELKPFQDYLDLAAHPRLESLILGGYGTDGYEVPWWRMSYYGDWQAGDEILERFPEKGYEDFAAFRREYLQVNRAARVQREKVERLKKELDAGQALDAEHDSNLQVLSQLDEHYLGNARVRIEQHLRQAGVHQLVGILPPALLALAKRWQGLEHQLRYMQEMRVHHLEAMQERLSTEYAKLTVKRAKLRRPKKRWKRFTKSEFERTFRDRTPKYQKHWSRYDQSYAALRDFDRYDDGYLDEGEGLWWDLFVDGRQSGNQLPGVRGYRERHPDYRYSRKRKRQGYEDAAQAVAEDAVSAGVDSFLFDDS